MFIDCMISPINVYLQYKINIVHKTRQQQHFGKQLKKIVHVLKYSGTRKDLSIDVSITTVGLILTKLGRFNPLSISQISILTFYKKKIKFLTFHAVASTLDDFSNDVSITTVGLILMKLGWFQHLGTSQNSISIFFEKKINLFFMGFHDVASSYSWRHFHWCINYDCRTDIDEAREISFLGVRTDRQFRNPHIGPYLHTKNFNSKLQIKI